MDLSMTNFGQQFQTAVDSTLTAPTGDMETQAALAAAAAARARAMQKTANEAAATQAHTAAVRAQTELMYLQIGERQRMIRNVALGAVGLGLLYLAYRRWVA